jgi:flagellar basal body rod protein FlgB
MPVLNDRLSALMDQKVRYLSKKAQVETSNITNSEMKNARRKELAPFTKILKSAPKAHDLQGRAYNDIKNFKVTENHVRETKDEISAEMEMMKLTKGTTDHDGLLNIIKSFHRMIRSIIAK